MIPVYKIILSYLVQLQSPPIYLSLLPFHPNPIVVLTLHVKHTHHQRSPFSTTFYTPPTILHGSLLPLHILHLLKVEQRFALQRAGRNPVIRKLLLAVHYSEMRL